MRILIISNNPFSNTQNNGKTIASFFKDVDIKNIAQLYMDMSHVPDSAVCENYYRITEKDIIKSFLNFSFRVKNSHTLFNTNIESTQYNLSQGKTKLKRLVKKYKGLFTILRDLIWSFNTWDTFELRNWIQKFNPHIIFCVLGDSIFVHKLCYKLAKIYNIPLVVYFTDDYIINNTSTNFLDEWHYRRLCKVYSQTMEKADYVYVIGEKMRIDYEKRFQRKMGTLVNSVDFSSFSKLEPILLDKHKDIIISFIGGIHLNRWVSIARLGKIVKEMNETWSLKIRIKVFCLKEPKGEIEDAFAKNNIEYGGALNQQGVLHEINNSHFLLHVESFDKKNRLYTKYSVSTKIPEYLASKRRIIAFGPHEVASISLLSNSNLACCLTDLDSEETMKCKLIEAINSYNDFDYQTQYQYASDNFDQIKVGRSLLNEMSRLLKK